MIEFLVALIAFGFVLGLLVTLHEFGHFYFAKKAGILCSEFSIGMGPVIYKVKKGETYYSIRALPIGGFVSMAGEDLNENLIMPGMKISVQLDNNKINEIILDPKIEGSIVGRVISRELYGKENAELYIELDVNGEVVKYLISDECYYVTSSKQKMLLAPYGRCFESKTILERFLTVIAGPIMNLLLALVLFLVVGLASGVSTNENVIGEVSTYTAQEYLEENDIIKQIGDTPITQWDDIGLAMDIMQNLGATIIPMTIKRDGNEEDILVNVKVTIQINNVGITNLNNTEGSDYQYDGEGILLGEIPSGNKAASVGLKKGDILTRIYIDNKEVEINSWHDALNFFGNVDSGDIKIGYIRGNEFIITEEVELFTVKTLESQNAPIISYVIGISPTTEFSLLGGIKNGFSLTISNALIIFNTLSQVINPAAQLGVSDLSGPIGIFAVVRSYIDAGMIPFISLMGMLSVNLFIMNLLPLPALDGGRLVFLGYEAVTKKPINKKIENTITMIGFAILMAIMMFVTLQDIIRL